MEQHLKHNVPGMPEARSTSTIFQEVENAYRAPTDISLFSSSLPVIPHKKYGFPLEDETEDILPEDEDELFAGIDFDLGDLPAQLEDLDDDIFESGGGMEMDFDSQDRFRLDLSNLNLSDGVPIVGINRPELPNGGPAVVGEHPYGEHPSRTLFVRNINSNVEDIELKSLFEEFGEIRNLYTACKHRGFVMISYYDIRHARAAMRELQNKPLRRRKLDIHFSIPKDNPSEKDLNQGTLVVFNLDASISSDDLRQIFAAYGEVKEIRETPHKRHHKFIEFYDVRAAEMALKALNGAEIAGKRIKLEHSRPGGARRSLMQQLSLELDHDETRPFWHPGGSPVINSPPGSWNHLSSPGELSSQQGYSWSSGFGTISPVNNNPLRGLASILPPHMANPVKIAPIGKDSSLKSTHGFDRQQSEQSSNFDPSSVGRLSNVEFLWGSPQSSSWLASPKGPLALKTKPFSLWVLQEKKNKKKMGGVKDIKSKQELDNLVKDGSAVMVHFWASWCDASKHMDQVFSHLSADFPNAHFLRVEAEEQPEISEAYSVSAVPFFVFIKDGKKVDTLEGAYPAELANKVSKVVGSIHAGEPAAPASLGMAAGPSVLEAIQDLAKINSSSQGNTHPSPPAGVTDLNTRLEKLTHSHPIMLFMKGTPEQPKCGFSKKVVEILKAENVKFGTFDILSDNEVREGLKKFSNWPTYPQLYCKGELLGGSDIIIAMHEGDELKQAFADHGVDDDVSKSAVVEPNGQKAGVTDSAGLSSALSSRLESLINSAPVMLFMKGNPDEPRCGFSRKVVEILREEKVSFKTFDILSDEEVRQGLKVYSNWSSYPQLYIKSELIGGSDIVLEMQKSGELQKILIEKGIISLEDRLKKLVNSAPVMLFMKGTPDAPECGFSSKVVNALKEEGIKFGSFDIYSDEEVRQGLKTFSNWPTFPQLYYKGELIGGCDIVLDLKSNGELASTLSE